ncbi:MAG: trypsin-like peptidase domain-containing protein [Acidimicrobiia bacterium]|nr:trypsin-like peptidase domain-containing protein [Acidimicrobiia bacterium]
MSFPPDPERPDDAGTGPDDAPATLEPERTVWSPAPDDTLVAPVAAPPSWPPAPPVAPRPSWPSVPPITPPPPELPPAAEAVPAAEPAPPNPPSWTPSSDLSAPPSPSATPEVRTVTPRWVTPLVILAALALFAGGGVAGWAIAERDDPPSAQVDARRDVEGSNVPVSNPVSGASLEPVADVAAAVSPSVVQIETNTGLGSGVIFDDEGHILTAAHVIDGATQIRVRLANGTLVAAEIIGTNAATDVGVVAIEPQPDMLVATLGDGDDIEVGQMAVAVGSPFELQQTVTSGIISAVDRPVPTEADYIVGMIQTDAPINPGNSGGALADRNGRVIGINDAIRTQGGGNEGVGFAIPIDLAKMVAERLIAGEDIRYGFLGVGVTNPSEGRAGALVQNVSPDTAAETAGIEAGDLIVSFDGQTIRDRSDLRARVLATPPGEEIVVEVVRDGKELTLEASLDEYE